MIVMLTSMYIIYILYNLAQCMHVCINNTQVTYHNTHKMQYDLDTLQTSIIDVIFTPFG